MGEWFVYVLQSEKNGRFYKGISQNLDLRLKRHNSGVVSPTKSGISWKLIWFCQKLNKSEAVILERKLKNLSRERIVEFIAKYS